MDELDRKIIAELQNDGRQTNTGIATKLGVSEATVRRRIEWLLANEVIRITAVPDLAKVGYATIALIAIQGKLQRLDDIADALAAHSSVHYVAQTTGRYDIIIWALFRSVRELADFMKSDLAAISGIERTETLINLNVAKRSLG